MSMKTKRAGQGCNPNLALTPEPTQINKEAILW